MPDAAQSFLNFLKAESQRVALGIRTAQIRVGLLLRVDLKAKTGRESPHQQLGQIVQQRCNADFFHVDVVAPDRPFLSVVGGSL